MSRIHREALKSLIAGTNGGFAVTMLDGGGYLHTLVMAIAIFTITTIGFWASEHFYGKPQDVKEREFKNGPPDKRPRIRKTKNKN
ncbi:hypothetical protein [Halorussus caseinilyticus]|uniref:Uncharacterized protein n=1 Tax=Halorussus caseinilyticus TaxID=3034025 RepID=A0ABD5WDV7_9EURY|nr:hypothetical protein [Halorussus sp. DT72]